jgi:hypothetical protein
VNKSELLETLLEQRERWECLMSHVPGEDRTAPGLVGQWSAQDLLAHVMAYEEYLLDRLEELRSGQEYVPAQTEAEREAFLERYGYPDFGSPLIEDDGPNEWVVAKYRTWTYGDVDTREGWIFGGLLDRIRSLPDAEGDAGLFDWIADYTFEHYRHHSAALIEALGEGTCD